MKNLLQIATEKKLKIQSMTTVKLTACQSLDGIIIISENGIVIPQNEVQKFENNIAYVSGAFALDNLNMLSICRMNKI